MDSHAATPAPGQHELVLNWLTEDRPEQLERLWHMADVTRARFVGDAVELCGTIKISNHCGEACSYCGLQFRNRDLHRYRLTPAQILGCAREAVQFGYRSVVLQAGLDGQLTAEWLGDIIRSPKKETGLAVGLSLGERSDEELAAWRKAGADRYYLRFLTADTNLYRLLHATASFGDQGRLPFLAKLKSLGYEVASGIIVGIPGQDVNGLAADIERIRALDLDAVLIGPYVSASEWRAMPASDAAYADVPPPALTALKAIALVRLLCPEADVPGTAALAAVGLADAPALALQRGANMLFPELTPRVCRTDYACYPGRVPLDELDYFNGRSSLRARLDELGRRPATEKRARRRSAAEASALSPAPRAEPELRVTVCMGSSCFSRGNNRTVTEIRDFIERHHLAGRAVLEGHLCTGMCKHGPNVGVGSETHSHADAAAVIELLRHHFSLKE